MADERSIHRVRINYRRILQNHIFTNTEQKYMTLLPFERGIFVASYNDHDVQIDTNFTILLYFLLKLWRYEILR
jgi:hypothetical protein